MRTLVRSPSGTKLGAIDGDEDGARVGKRDGAVLCDIGDVGRNDGVRVLYFAVLVGTTVGTPVEAFDGAVLGTSDGVTDGATDGVIDGVSVL